MNAFGFPEDFWASPWYERPIWPGFAASRPKKAEIKNP
jgi:hypothetical protein